MDASLTNLTMVFHHCLRCNMLYRLFDVNWEGNSESRKNTMLCPELGHQRCSLPELETEIWFNRLKQPHLQHCLPAKNSVWYFPWFDRNSFSFQTDTVSFLQHLKCLGLLIREWNGPVHTGRGMRHAMRCKQIWPVDVNGGVYTAGKQHQRKNIGICVRLASRVLCGWRFVKFRHPYQSLVTKVGSTCCLPIEQNQLNICSHKRRRVFGHFLCQVWRDDNISIHKCSIWKFSWK